MEKALYTLDFEKPLRELENQLQNLQEMSAESKIDVAHEIAAIEIKIEATKRNIYSDLTPWQKVQLARHPSRPYTLDYIGEIFSDFEEIHGDRQFRDDAAIVGGPARFEGEPVMVIGQQKGRNTKENLRRNFGCPHPEGYRKALRLMRMAEKFAMPIVTLIDTPGAYPGIGAEERHVAEAIAVNIREMSTLRVPIIGAVIGEGGSGGALGIGLVDVMLVFENAYYSVISPEGCAAILWKDRKHSADAAAALKLNSEDLVKFGVADEVLEEPLGGAHRDPSAAADTLKAALQKHLKALRRRPIDQLLENRYQKYRNIGIYAEDTSPPREKEAEAASEETAQTESRSPS